MTMFSLLTLEARAKSSRCSVHHRPLRLALGAALAVLLAAAPAQAGAGDKARPKLDWHLQTVLDAGGPAQRVIVRTAPGAGQNVAARIERAGRRANRLGSGLLAAGGRH
jgi:hypothetical protein